MPRGAPILQRPRQQDPGCLQSGNIKRRKFHTLKIAVAGIPLALMGLVACPIPQEVPVFVVADAGISPPRIVTELAKPSQTIIYVKDNCPPGSTFNLSAVIRHEGKPAGLDEQIEARWLVDYSEQRPAINGQQTIRAAEEKLVAGYPLEPFSFKPLVLTSSSVHVVELVVSNGFQESDGGTALPFRSAAPGFETQVFRWVFQIVPATDSRGVCELKQ